MDISGMVGIVILIPMLLYALLMVSFLIGWILYKPYRPGTGSPERHITILIPCRNEKDNIPILAQLLINQDYPQNLFEIIWIDDHSSDGTRIVLEELVGEKPNHRLIRLTENQQGKKQALKAGMKQATGELILLTDADSRPGPRWVKTMARFFEDTGTDLILGPVMLDPATRWFEKAQKLEFMSLVSASIGAAGIGHPIMAQGPNIAVRATDYAKMVTDLGDPFISGDDVFLLQKMKRIRKKKIRYILHPDAVITTRPAATLADFIHQRQRWASKAKGYSDPYLVFTTVIVFFASIEITALFVSALFGITPFSMVLVLLGIKTLADTPLIIKGLRFFGSVRLLLWLLPVQLLYPVYVTLVGIRSQISVARW